MSRRAILLSASPEPNAIPSLSADLAAFDAFLRSNLGGAWENSEISISENPTREQILAAIKAAKTADYSIVFFAGRGEILKMGLPWTEMRLSLGSGETITEREINTGSPRCALILDCCYRTPKGSPAAFPVKPSTFLKYSGEPSDFRALYQEGFEKAEGGFVKVYATTDSNSTPDAQSFTQHLLSRADAWASSHKGTLYLGDAVTLANDAMQQESTQQQAVYHGGRRLHDFPFAAQT